MLELSDFNYTLPENLIAQKPVSPRDHSRLLVLHKDSGEIEHKHFYDIVDYLKPDDVLVVNNSKVFPARLLGQKILTGGRLEVFLLKKIQAKNKIKFEAWECLIGGRAQEGMEIKFKRGLRAKLLKKNLDSTWQVEFNRAGLLFMKTIETIGQVPLPPYIKTPTGGRFDKKNYQTVYANQKKTGSVAAPTAGFHFTPKLLREIKKKGITVLEVTLHVGLGTFLPVKTNNILEHQMHAEYIEVKKAVIKKILAAKKNKQRIIAVGTTSARTLETLGQELAKKSITSDFRAWTSIFIYPPYQFKIVDALITNFHLPASTLLMLVSALAGKAHIDKAYKSAITSQYRFFSYGDAMFIC